MYTKGGNHMYNNGGKKTGVGGASVGEVRVLSKGGVDRLVLVKGVDGKTCQFTLLHSYAEYATVYDLIVEPIVSGLSYTIVVQEDLLATVYTERLGVLRGRLPTLLGGRLGIYSGAHYPHPPDAIWQFKVAEGATIRELCDIDEILYNLDNDI